MEKTFFDEELVKNSKTVSCPSCKKHFKVSLADTRFFCDDCGECIEIEFNSFSDDFVWYPSEKY